MRLLRAVLFSLAASSILAGVCARAQTAVPEPLRAWREWVLHGQEFLQCPALNASRYGVAKDHICAWPGKLSIVADTKGAEFDQAWTVYAQDWVPLPGSMDYWPSDVRVDGKMQPVVEHDGRPTLRVAAGSHRVSGRLTWDTRPASISVPREVALVSLRVDGRPIAHPDIERNTLWLGLRPNAAVAEDRLDVVVYRRLSDTLPMRLQTVVQLDIAGQNREVDLHGALLSGFVGETLESGLPAQLGPDGTLRVQGRPGHWKLTLTAHSPAPVASITLPQAVDPWPAEEIWSFDAQPRLRVAALVGAPAVDTERSGVPAEWKNLPSYRLSAGQSVSIVERSRVDAAAANRLALRRDLWLDFDGRAFTARDTVQGEMRRGWRLDMAAPYTMTMAALNGQNLLITEGSAPGRQGVELRAPQLTLTTTSRVAADGPLPVTGYEQTFDDATTTLHVPPGYLLMAAPGADQATRAWLESWRLLDVFVVLIIGVAAWRLFGTVPGVVALAAMLFMFHEPWAPRWAWLNALVAIALLRVAPEGRLRRLTARYRLLSLALLVLLLVPFTITELRSVVFVQLERPMLERGSLTATRLAPAAGAAGQPLARRAQQPAALASKAASGALEEVTVSGNRIARGVARYLPGAVVQTGPGLPDWDWTRYSLHFNGPITANQTYRLVLLGPWLVRLWRLLSVALALTLLWLLAGRPKRMPRAFARAAGGAAALIVCAAVLPRSAHAQAATEYPPPALLQELKNRLTEPAPCHPDCAELTRASVDVKGETLTVILNLAVQDTVAVPVPSVIRGWRPVSISIDGAPVGFLYRDPAETAWLRVAEGVHRVELSGPLPDADNVSLPFPLPPRFIDVSAPGWTVTGVSEGRLRSGTLELVRQRQAPGSRAPAAAFPPYVRIVRRVTFDLDWTVETTVQRVAPANGAFTLQVDLLPKEAIITPGIEAAQGRATVAFAAGQKTVRWRSRLPTAASLSLTAQSGRPWAEEWQFVVGNIWHADFDGLPASPPARPDPSFWVPEYYPRPGETLTVNLRQPQPAGGDTIAIDTVDYARNVGRRLSGSSLDFTYRSTRGGEHVITLPQSSMLDGVTVDGKTTPLQLDGNRLSVPVTPGRHRVEVRWRNGDGAATRNALVAVDLGGGATNIRSTLSLGADRWILYTFGPTLGPAVLYWPELLIFALAAWVLGRIPLSPLRTREWLLLGLGLSTFAWPVLGVFVVWAFALSWRGRTEPALSGSWFNVLQVGLGVLTVVALVMLVGAIPTGLLGRPNMQLVSPVGPGALSWFADRTTGMTPTAGVISVSLWFYKAAMLAWALWLSFALLRWLPWAWRAFSHGGAWRGRLTIGKPARRSASPR